ncbi:hypothetical protein Droror1_Dr00015981 [Drosera rotundifolia]
MNGNEEVKMEELGEVEGGEELLAVVGSGSPGLGAASGRSGVVREDLEVGFEHVSAAATEPVVVAAFVAVGAQGGTNEIVDVAANAFAACFSVHGGAMRGLL